MTWKDTTSYSQNGDKTPHWWRITVGRLRVDVGDSHLYVESGKWIMHCSPWFNTHILHANNETDAKREALGLIEMELNRTLEALREGVR